MSGNFLSELADSITVFMGVIFAIEYIVKTKTKKHTK